MKKLLLNIYNKKLPWELLWTVSSFEEFLRDFRTREIENAIRDYKNNNNVKRLSKLQKNRIAMDFDGSELWQLIANARDDIASYNWF